MLNFELLTLFPSPGKQASESRPKEQHRRRFGDWTVDRGTAWATTRDSSCRIYFNQSEGGGTISPKGHSWAPPDFASNEVRAIDRKKKAEFVGGWEGDSVGRKFDGQILVVINVPSDSVQVIEPKAKGVDDPAIVGLISYASKGEGLHVTAVGAG